MRIFHLSIQHLKSDADFLKASTVDRVKKHLNSMDSELKKKLKYAKLLRSRLYQVAVKLLSHGIYESEVGVIQ